MNGIVRIVTNARRGRAIIHNGTLYIGGQTASNKVEDIRDQTQQTLDKIDKVLAEAGTDKRHLLTAQIWIKDIVHDFLGMNEVWDAWIDVDAAPARATAQCEMANPRTLVEIVVTAAMSTVTLANISTTDEKDIV